MPLPDQAGVQVAWAGLSAAQKAKVSCGMNFLQAAASISGTQRPTGPWPHKRFFLATDGDNKEARRQAFTM